MVELLCKIKFWRPWQVVLFFFIAIFYPGNSTLNSQTASIQTYQMPPKALADLVDAPPTPAVQVDPTQKWLLILEQPNLPAIAELAQPELRLAGIRINPRTNGRSRRSYYTALKLKKISGGEDIAIQGLPENARIRNVTWSPNGKYLAFTNVANNDQSLWVVDVTAKKARKLISARLSSVYGAPFQWLSDNQTLVCKTIPAERGEAPPAPTVPMGPVMQETSGKKAPARTYQDLLKNSHDEALFEYYLTTQILRVTLDGKSTKLGNLFWLKPSTDRSPISSQFTASLIGLKFGIWMGK
ncbi:MAG: hypothetical protein ACE5HI_07575 [bacterium]